MSLADKVMGMLNDVAPASPAVEVAEAVAATVVAPTPANLIADVELAITLFKEFRAKTAGLHPTVWDVIKLLV